MKIFLSPLAAAVLALAACSPEGKPTDPGGDPDPVSDVPTQGLMAHYPFDGNANDAGSYMLHGTPHGGTDYTVDRFGNPSKAVIFDGTTGYVEVQGAGAHLDPKAGMTVSFYINGTALRGYDDWNNIISKGAAFGDGYYIKWCHDGQSSVRVFLVEGASGYNTPHDAASIPSQPFMGSWHHIAMTWDSVTATMSLYRDGVEVASKSNCIYRGSTTHTSFFMGGWPALMADGVVRIASTPAKLDDVRFYDRALSQAEIGKLVVEGGFVPSPVL